VKPKAFEILRYLVDHAGCLATQEELLDAIWPNTSVQPEVLKRHIADLREVLGDDPRSPTFIETRPWRGYQFIAAVRTTAGAEIGHPMFIFTAPDRTTGQGQDCEMKKADIRKEIDKLIQVRRNIDRAIDDFERLEASLTREE
jgi:DNA-binding winged helix-turn-helix (wHTH) protein